MKQLILLPLLILSFTACNKDNDDDDNEPGQLPVCVQQIIDDNTGDWTAGYERRIDGEQFFYFRAGCCDRFNILFDEDCNEVCAPDGGFTGGGDGQCPDFSNAVIEDTLIWERE